MGLQCVSSQWPVLSATRITKRLCLLHFTDYCITCPFSHEYFVFVSKVYDVERVRVDGGADAIISRCIMESISTQQSAGGRKDVTI